MRKKKILIIVFILLCALTGISVGHYFWKESKKMTGVEWFAEQESYVKQMETYTDSMDDIMTLYLNGTITKDDFLKSYIELSRIILPIIVLQKLSISCLRILTV